MICKTFTLKWAMQSPTLQDTHLARFFRVSVIIFDFIWSRFQVLELDAKPFVLKFTDGVSCFVYWATIETYSPSSILSDLSIYIDEVLAQNILPHFSLSSSTYRISISGIFNCCFFSYYEWKPNWGWTLYFSRLLISTVLKRERKTKYPPWF